MKEAESDVSGGLNDCLRDLCNVLIFEKKQMIASGGKLEFVKRQRVGDESLASIKIDVKAINDETR